MSNVNTEATTPIQTLDGLRAVYFIGIGGIGMSAIARYFHAKGLRVSGYDRTSTELTRELEASGISVHYSDDLNLVDKEADLVVYTPAIPAQHTELTWYRAQGYPVVKRSDVLQIISAGSYNICVAGTHGKTTISTMTAHVLRHSGYGCNAFLGGISSNYNTNFWSSERNICVIEADEYDRSFLKLSPDIAVISAMDADHLDIYGDEASLQDAFVAFGGKVKEGGVLLAKFGLKRIREVKVANRLSYSLQNDAADVFASDVQIRMGGYRFTAQVNGTMYSGLELNVGGMHNVENALVAIAVAHLLEIGGEKIRAALADFKGVHRRFEYVLPPKKISEGAYVPPVLIDDYAHHPEELRALLSSVRSLFPQRIVTVVFQPHLFSRTRDFAPGFSESLSLADRVILLPIYPARELPMEGVTSELIGRKVSRETLMLDKEGLLHWMKEHAAVIDKEFGEVIVIAGAGDIDALVQPVKEILEKA